MLDHQDGHPGERILEGRKYWVRSRIARYVRQGGIEHSLANAASRQIFGYDAMYGE